MRNLALIPFTLALSSQAALVRKDLSYFDGKSELVGYLVYDDAPNGKRPGVLVTHNWMGLSDHTKAEADALAKEGYVAFAVDVYGKGQRPKDAAEAGKFAGLYKNDRALFRSRMKAGLNTLLKEKNVDAKKIGAIGFCFGGTGVVELARSGAQFNGGVSFHGGLDSPRPADGKNIKAKLLILHGAVDPFISDADLKAFETELNQSKVDYQLVKYSGAVHAFTEKAAGNDPSKGAAYNEKADQRSRLAMTQFFQEVFK